MDRHPMIAIFHLIFAIGLCSSARAFVAPPATTPFSQRSGGVANTDASTPSSSTSLFDIAQQYEESKNVGLTLYPVISRIASKNWTGSCKYVGSDLVHLSKLKLTGGVRYDVVGRNVTLSSYLAFPNGNTREVVMTGGRDSSASSADSPVITLRSIAEDGQGPIRMLLTEVGSDTILVNEVEEATGKTILTSSTSIVSDGNELVQVSHEVGEGGVAGIEGHQVWRLTEEAPRRVAPGKDADAARDALGKRERERAAEAAKSDVPVEFDDFEDFRDATGR